MDWKFEKARTLYEIQLEERLYLQENFNDQLMIGFCVYVAATVALRCCENYIDGYMFSFWLGVVCVIMNVFTIGASIFRLRYRKKHFSGTREHYKRVLDIINSHLNGVEDGNEQES